MTTHQGFLAGQKLEELAQTLSHGGKINERNASKALETFYTATKTDFARSPFNEGNSKTHFAAARIAHRLGDAEKEKYHADLARNYQISESCGEAADFMMDSMWGL